MSASPFAAAPSVTDGPAMREAPLRVCIHGLDLVSAAELDALRARLPAGSRIALFGPGADTVRWSDAEHVRDVAGDWHPDSILAAAAARFRGDDVLIVRADVELPDLACERLLRALAEEGVVGALPLDGAWRRPIPNDCASDATAARIDALCYAYSDRRLHDDATFASGAATAFSAWHGERLARIDAAHACDRDALDAAGLRIVVLDHLYVKSGTAIRTPRPTERDPRDPEPPSPLAALQQRVAAALATKATPARPGLDAKPVILHVLHGWGGGAERWVRDFAAADTQAHHLVLIARGSFTRRRHGEWLELHDGSMAGPPLRRLRMPVMGSMAASSFAQASALRRSVTSRCRSA
jgi:hypothetical protein